MPRPTRNPDRWLDTFIVVLVVTVVGIAAMAPRVDRREPLPVVAMKSATPACGTLAGSEPAVCVASSQP